MKRKDYYSSINVCMLSNVYYMLFINVLLIFIISTVFKIYTNTFRKMDFSLIMGNIHEIIV